MTVSALDRHAGQRSTDQGTSRPPTAPHPSDPDPLRELRGPSFSLVRSSLLRALTSVVRDRGQDALPIRAVALLVDGAGRRRAVLRVHVVQGGGPA